MNRPNRPRICAVIVSDDPEKIRAIGPSVDLFEVRIDLIGDGWREVVKHVGKPWIACNRRAGEGGRWRGSESGRIDELLKAVGLGASMVDIELETGNIGEVVKLVKEGAECLLSYHDLNETPTLNKMRKIVKAQLQAGADICKLVTTARSFEDNLAVLKLISDFPEARVVSFAMGPLGDASRILCPLVGGEFIYASIERGGESAPGQVTVGELRKIYGMLAKER